jgi:hypothetical protein
MWRTAIFLSMLFALAATALAQQSTPSVPRYEPQKQEKLSGTIDQVNEYHCAVSGTVGAHLTLKDSAGATVEVHLAPVKFMKEYGISITPGAKAEIVGMRATIDGKPAMLAKSAKIGQDMYTFRDDDGRPLW